LWPEKSRRKSFEIKPLELRIVLKQPVIKIESVNVDVRSHQIWIKQKPP
jgi:hypothetical protein